MVVQRVKRYYYRNVFECEIQHWEKEREEKKARVERVLDSQLCLVRGETRMQLLG